MIPGIAPTKLDSVSDGLSMIRRIADPDRMRRLDGYERLWKGLAYEGRASFWDTSVPLAERAPCVTSGLPEASIKRLTALVFGARQFPQVGVERGHASAKVIDPIIKSIVAHTQFPLRQRKALEQGLAIGTWCMILALVDGLPQITLQSAKLALAERDRAGNVTSLEIRYRYQGVDANGKPITLWYRRHIDAMRDVVFQAVEAREDGYDPPWIEDAERSFDHNLGFCPVWWHRHDADPSDTDGIDGSPMFAGMEDELEALDFALSQHHRNGRYNGEPQVVVSGAGKIDAETGRQQTTNAPQSVGPNGKPVEPFSWFNSMLNRTRGGGSAQKKAPGKVWFLTDPGAAASLLESSGAGAQVLREDAAQLRRAILEAKAIVIASPEDVSANASAALMETLHAPMIDHADTIRLEYEPVVIGVVRMLLRLCAVCESRALGSVLIPGMAQAASLIAAKPPLSLSWGRYYEPTLQDISLAIDAAAQASGKPVLSQRTAIRLLSTIIDIDSEDEELERIAIENAPPTQAQTIDPNAPPDSTVPTVDPLIAEGAAVSDTALNGAQVSSLVDVVSQVAMGTLPKEAAFEIIAKSFPSFDRASIERMFAFSQDKPQ